jgi:hypothetical protein
MAEGFQSPPETAADIASGSGNKDKRIGFHGRDNNEKRELQQGAQAVAKKSSLQ